MEEADLKIIGWQVLRPPRGPRPARYLCEVLITLMSFAKLTVIQSIEWAQTPYLLQQSTAL